MKKTTITVELDTAKQLRMFKIKSDAKNLDEVIKIVISKLEEHLKEKAK